MSVYNTFCFLAAAAILIAFINSKLIKMQATIAITAGSLALALVIIIAGQLDWFYLNDVAIHTINNLHFETFLLKGVLSFLLFAGGLGIKLSHLQDQKWEIAVLALGGTLISTFIIGFALFYLCQYINLPLNFIYCLLFGALISPTDPIAVMAIVKQLNAPRRIATQVEGESLFNDGIGLVIFVTISGIAFSQSTPTIASVSQLFLQEAIGGIVYGLVLGLIFHLLIRAAAGTHMQLLLTMIIPTSGYALSFMLEVSGPLAMVVSGIMIGNWTRKDGFSEEGGNSLDKFWSLIDEFLNSLLFLLIGLVMLTLSFHREDLLLMLIAVPLVLFSRYCSVAIPYIGFRRLRHYNPLSEKILTWGGLRGGLALALAMSVPKGIMIVPEHNIDVSEIILVMTFSVVVFSILIQGLTITPMIEKAKQLEGTSANSGTTRAKGQQ
ncbi:Na(+)/H(+) antiporter NhaP [Sinobacterium norvegicum]|uniref:Na(+)/H(+) antiporter NhaP n=1 Tax=Sinobacterium norvegicum TaxID=1641715 RepID=A0ABN8EN51_9GAMM|nr:sodium:proton antiporter [Sinobacterium norvegicum]CAH0992640.1 Na(+)/H(+) antiporter NhaP [Sinobacterium norvegicum]